MTKQVPLRIAKAAYDLQEYCRTMTPNNCFFVEQKGKCRVCSLLTPQVREFISPSYYHITKADIERLERESNDD